MAVNRKSDITAEIIPEEKGLEETKVRVIIPLKEDDGSGLHNDQTECVIINGNTTLIKRGEYVDVSVPVFVQLKQRYGGGKHNPQSDIQQQRRTFNNAIFEWISKKNGELLEREDAFFLNRHFSNALAGYLQANKVDLSNVDDATLQAGLTYAIKEAKKATYRDNSDIADRISKFSRGLATSEKMSSRVLGAAFEGAFPFKKTPINVMKRGIEYSPIGFMKTLFLDTSKMKKGKISTAEYFDSLGSGVVGTLLAAAGAWAYSLGHLKIDLDDKEDELDKLDGSQEYSVEFSLFGNDISYTIDWMSPSAMPFFVGAAIADLFKDKNEEVNIGTVWDSLMNITEPVFNLSVMEGVNKLLSSASYKENGVVDVLMSAGESYAAQFVQKLLRSGKMSQQQLDMLQGVASQLQQFMGM